MQLIVTIGLFVLALASPAFAQVIDNPAPTPGADWFANAGSIALATVILVGGLKRALANVSGLQDIPTWLYAVGVSIVLTLIARSVFHTMQGPLAEVLMSAVVAAAVASGAREWFTSGNTTKSLRSSAITAGVKGVQ